METKHNHYKTFQIDISHGQDSSIEPLAQYRFLTKYCSKCKIEFTQTWKIGMWKPEDQRSDNPCGQASGDLQYWLKTILISEKDIVPTPRKLIISCYFCKSQHTLSDCITKIDSDGVRGWKCPTTKNNPILMIEVDDDGTCIDCEHHMDDNHVRSLGGPTHDTYSCRLCPCSIKVRRS